MKVCVTLEWKGIPEMLARLNELQAAMRDALKEGMDDFGKDARDVMKGHTHVQSGRLRGGTELEPGEYKFTLKNLTERLRYGGQRMYSKHVEFGTSKMSARPYLKPTVEWATGTMADRLAGSVKKVLG